MSDPNSAKRAAGQDNPQAANPSAPAEVVVDPAHPQYLEQRRRLAADEAREGLEKAARTAQEQTLAAAVITAQGTVQNPAEAAPPAGSPQGAVPNVGGTTVTESVDTTRTAPESGVRRGTTNR